MIFNRRGHCAFAFIYFIMNTWINKLSSRIYNDLVSGLRGYHNSTSLPLEQIEDEIITTRLLIIKEYQLKGILPKGDLFTAINCIPIDCKNLEKCSCISQGTVTQHFEIPQIVLDYGEGAIGYIGTIDKNNSFNYYISTQEYNMYHKYKKRRHPKPYVYIDVTPNENGMLDCYIFNAPLLKFISVTAIIKDPRQLCVYKDCVHISDENISWIEEEIQKRIVDSKIKLYRQLQAPILPNTQTPNV